MDEWREQLKDMEKGCKQLKEKIEGILSDDPRKQEDLAKAEDLSNAVNEYIKEIESLHEKDQKGDLLYRIDQAEKEKLLGIHYKIAQRADKIMDLGLLSLIKTAEEICKSAWENYKMLMRYTPSPTSNLQKNIDELESENPALLRMNVPNYLGLNDVKVNRGYRKVVTYRDEKTGKPTTVLFTPERSSDSNYFKRFSDGFSKDSGSRVDTRSSAMCAVAALLDMPEVIADSKDGELVDLNINEFASARTGAHYYGTIMSKVDGMDVAHPTEEDINRINQNPKNSVEHCTLDFVKDVTHLQVLDFVCGYTKRHGQNIIYQFDENNNLNHAIGIGNDSSFPRWPLDKEKVTDWKPLENLRVIPADTAKIVMELKPEVLKYSLQGFGLFQREINQVAYRLRDLREHIQKHPGYVYTDEKLHRAFENELKAGGKTIFSEVKEVLSPDTLKQTYQNNIELEKMIKESWSKPGPSLFANWDFECYPIIDEKNRATPAGLKYWMDKTKTLSTLLDSGTKWYRGSSFNYKIYKLKCRSSTTV